jgi:hypothetical protein
MTTMPKDFKVELLDFIKHNGFSGKYFLSHVQFLHSWIHTHKNQAVKYTLYRFKMVLEGNGRKLIVRPHALGHSNRYATLFNEHGKELCTFRFDLSSEIIFSIILHYLND